MTGSLFARAFDRGAIVFVLVLAVAGIVVPLLNLLTPPASGVGALAWALPVVAVICGAGALWWAFHKWESKLHARSTAADRALVEKARGG